jgi:hypothetical protein
LYAEAFQLVPTNTYVGINAASKSAMLDELHGARAITPKVLDALAEVRKANGSLSHDAWLQATEPEALLRLGRWDEAIAGLHAAKVAHRAESGSIDSTADQVRRLIPHVAMPDEVRARLLAEFEGFAAPSPTTGGAIVAPALRLFRAPSHRPLPSSNTILCLHPTLVPIPGSGPPPVGSGSRKRKIAAEPCAPRPPACPPRSPSDAGATRPRHWRPCGRAAAGARRRAP